MARFIGNIICLLFMTILVAGCGGGGNGNNGGGGGAASSYVVSGSVLSPSGSVLPGVTVTLTGASTITTTTNSAGTYTFTAVANGNYALSSSFSGYTFSSINNPVVVSNTNVTGQNFVGTANSSQSIYSVSGAVISNGSVLPGVTVTLAGANTISTTTDANGSYSFTGVVSGNYTLSASLSGYTLSPASIPVVVGSANVSGQNFVGTANSQNLFSISGRVTYGVLGYYGAMVTLKGANTITTTTDANGDYSLAGIANGNYALSVSSSALNGYNFSPVSIPVIINSGNVTGQNFIGTYTPIYYTISGMVASNKNMVLPGATVTLSKIGYGNVASATTDSVGKYTLTSVVSGTYTLTVHSPPNDSSLYNDRQITVTTGNLTGVNLFAYL